MSAKSKQQDKIDGWHLDVPFGAGACTLELCRFIWSGEVPFSGDESIHL
jgi:hypothetical protein